MNHLEAKYQGRTQLALWFMPLFLLGLGALNYNDSRGVLGELSELSAPIALGIMIWLFFMWHWAEIVGKEILLEKRNFFGTGFWLGVKQTFIKSVLLGLLFFIGNRLDGKELIESFQYTFLTCIVYVIIFFIPNVLFAWLYTLVLKLTCLGWRSLFTFKNQRELKIK